MPDDTPTMAQLRARIRAVGALDYTVWIKYVSFGGSASYVEFEAYLHEALVPPEGTAALLAFVVWEFEQFGS